MLMCPSPICAQNIDSLKPGIVKIIAQNKPIDPQTKELERVGTGIIVRLEKKEAYIVTASHVIEGAQNLQVVFFTDPNNKFSARELGTEGGEGQGVAVLCVEGMIPEDLLVLTLDRYAEIVVNEEVSFIGFPVNAGTPWAVGQGVISGFKGKQITFTGGPGEGNSGGPLIKGSDVIGVITSAAGIYGYATPSNVVLQTLKGWKITDDYQIYYDRVQEYYQRGEYKQYINAAEDLLLNQAVLGKLSSQERLKKEIMLHVEIAFTLLTNGYIDGIDSPWQKALVHAEQARLAAPSLYLNLFLLGNATAYQAEDMLDDPSTKGAAVDAIFSTAKQEIASKGLSEDSRTQAMVQYHYWFGRSLVTLKNYNRGKSELQAGLLLVKSNMPQMDKEKDKFLFQLGYTEWMQSKDIEAANQYWKDITDKYYAGNMFILVGLAYWEQGNKAKNMGKLEKAQEKFNVAEIALVAAKQSGHTSYSANLTLGALYFSRNDYVNAAAAFENAIQMDHSQAIAFYWAGRSLMKIQGRSGDARNAMERAVQLDPQNANAYYYLALMYGKDSNYLSAYTKAKKAIELDSHLTKAWELLILSIGVLAELEKPGSPEQITRYEEALITTYKGILECEQQKDVPRVKSFNKNKQQTWKSLAYAYAEREVYLGLALEYINSAVEAEPANPYYLDTKGWVLIKTVELSKDLTSDQRKQLLNEAQQFLNQAMISFSAEDTAAKAKNFYHLGYWEKLQGRKDKARELFLKALQLDPSYENAKKEM